MITKYNSFLDDKLNEGLWDSLRNFFGKLLQNVSDEIKKPVDDLSNKLGKTKDVKQMKNIIYNYLKIHNTTLTNQLKNTKDITGLNEVVTENIQGIYASIIAQTKSLGEDKYSFSEIFDDSPAEMKKLFDKNEKNFNKNLQMFVQNLIVSQAKQFGYKQDDVIAQLKPKKETTTPNKKSDVKLKQVDPKKEIEQIKKATGDVSASLNIKENDKLFEEATAPTVPTTTDTQTQTTEKPAQKPEKTEEDIKKESANFQKLKDSIKKWFDFAIYKKMNEALKNEKAGGGTIEDKIKNMATTKNTDSVNKIVDAITKTDKEKLKVVRDTLGLNKDTAPL